jgi:hypothetical protein
MGFESAISGVKSAIALQLEKLSRSLWFVEYCDRLSWEYFGKAIANLFCCGFKSAIALQSERLNSGSRFAGFCDRLFWGYFGKAIAVIKSAIALQLKKK